MTTRTRRLAGFDAVAMPTTIGETRLTLWQVEALERHVDRDALLRGDGDVAEPPYWAYLWSGARELAAAVPAGRGRAVEIGCGLGLPGLVAAARGWWTVCLDRVAAPLAFVQASAVSSGIALGGCVVTDATSGALRGRYDLLLAAEVLYERAAFGPMARAIAGYLAHDGVALVADGGRIDTREFYPELSSAGLVWRMRSVSVREEGLPVTVRLVEIRHGTGGQARPCSRIFR